MFPKVNGRKMSYTEAIEFINPAYNRNVAAFFPQPVLPSSSPPFPDSSVTASDERSLAVATKSFDDDITRQPHAVEGVKKKRAAESLRCEICSISCNSKKMFEKHLSGKKHIKKTGEKNSDALMLDHVKTVEDMEATEMRNLENNDTDASLPGAGLEEMCAVSNLSTGTQTIPEPSSSLVADVTLSSSGLDDEIMADKRQSTDQMKTDYSTDLLSFASNAYPVDDLRHLNSASRASIRVCKVCNIFSNSQVELEKHLAGKTHARKVKFLSTVMASPMIVNPTESNASKPASDTIHQADPPSIDPVGGTEIKETINSEGGEAISSPTVCTICNFKCSSQEIFENHLSGRKHASKVRMLGSSVHSPNQSMQDNGATERASKRGKIVKFAYCDVCKIYCNSSEILDAHIKGKKHVKQLEKLGK